LEGLLLSAKKRGIIQDFALRKCLIKLYLLYEEYIYPLLMSTFDGDFIDVEKKMEAIAGEIRDFGLMPTLEEMDEEISEQFALLTEEEKADLADLLKNP
jgi:hypothetical protein